MYLDWTKHLTDVKEQDRFQKSVLGSKQVLDRLGAILKEYEKSLDRSETDVSTYETPNWDYKQAHKNGYRACLTKIRDLINLDQRIIKP
jgi:hypothetical protein